MKGLAVTALFGLVGYLASFGIFIPPDLRFFNLLAAVGMMAGSAVGRFALTSKMRQLFHVLAIVGAALVCVACAITYVIRVQLGSSDISDVVMLAALISFFFFSFSFLVPLSGTVFDRQT